MQYHGGKARLASTLSRVIREAAPDAHAYLEPFMGGASMAAAMAPHYPTVHLGDADPDLVALWTAARDGWEPPTELSREQYAALRQETEPTALRAFAAHGMSFGGKRWGGYASNARGDDFAGAARRGVLKKGLALRGADIRQASYETWQPGAGWLVYCDPPYAGTTGYGAAWDPAEFWEVMSAWRDRGAAVFVSEYAAPEGWAPVWSKPHRVNMTKDDNRERVAVEHLFR